MDEWRSTAPAEDAGCLGPSPDKNGDLSASDAFFLAPENKIPLPELNTGGHGPGGPSPLLDQRLVMCKMKNLAIASYPILYHHFTVYLCHKI